MSLGTYRRINDVTFGIHSDGNLKENMNEKPSKMSNFRILSKGKFQEKN